MSKRKRESTLTAKVVFAWMIMMALSNIIIGTISFTLYKDRLLTARANEARDVAMAMAVRIDSVKFQAIMQTLEKDEYWYEVKAYADKISVVFDTAFIYILDGNYTDEVTYFAEGAPGDAPYDLGTTEVIEGVFADEMFDTLRTGNPTYTETYPSGEYGDMVSGFAAIKDETGKVAGVVGVDFFYGDIQAVYTRFAVVMIAIVVGFLVGSYFLMSYLGAKLAGKPLSNLDKAAQKLAVGNMDVSLNIRSSTEIGRLANSFQSMIETMKEQVDALHEVSKGDLTANIVPRGGDDRLGAAISDIIMNLNSMFADINSAAEMVASGARQISNNSQALAHGANQQTSAIENLHKAIGEMTEKAKDNFEIAVKTSSLTNTIKADAQVGSEHMDNMTLAVREISEASVSISKVIKVIDDIAFQTNILALNAAVEAARAGQHGKGFAVVAEEVRNLAAKSAEAAKDTERLISNSMEKAELGAGIASKTAESLSNIIVGVNECAESMSSIAEAFKIQIDAIMSINQGIEQVSGVIQQNSAAAEESAAASEEMSGQSDILEGLISNFKLKNQKRL